MTRSFNFIFPTANQWYRVWEDIILKDSSIATKLVNTGTVILSVPDLNFDFGDFIPSNVKVFKWQSQNAIVNPNNGGAVIEMSTDSNQEIGQEILSGSWDSISLQQSNISLRSIRYKSSNVGSGINLQLVA